MIIIATMNYPYGQEPSISWVAVDRRQKEKADMPDILHKVGIKSSSLNDVYTALATVEGLSQWWTSDTRGDSKVGSVIQFRFGAGGFDMKVLELQPAKRVLWQVIDGPGEWLGAKINFDLKQESELVILHFKTASVRE